MYYFVGVNIFFFINGNILAIRFALFWDVTRRRVVIVYRRFFVSYWDSTSEDGTDTLYRNVGKQLPHDAA